MRFLSVFLDAVLASILLIPVFLVLHRTRFHSAKNTILYTVFSIYLAAVYSVVGLPNVTYVRFEPNLNLVPFLNMFSALTGTILNVILFVPMGFFLMLLWKRFRNPLRCILFGFAASLTIEILQIFTFRATDINDLITNTLGTLIGWLLGYLVLKCCPKLVCDNDRRDLPIVLGTVFCVMFFVFPFLYNFVWHFIL